MFLIWNRLHILPNNGISRTMPRVVNERSNETNEVLPEIFCKIQCTPTIETLIVTPESRAGTHKK